MATTRSLSDQEVSGFIKGLDKDSDGCISYPEVEHMLDEVHKEIVPEPKAHHLHHNSRSDQERHQFLRYVMGTDKDRIPADEFATIVKSWNVPSSEQDRQTEQDSKEYMRNLPIGRRLRAFWEVDGPESLFLVLVVSLQVAFGTWQLVKYVTETQYRQAFGWGIVLAKTSAGALYPTLFSWCFPCPGTSQRSPGNHIMYLVWSIGTSPNPSTSRCRLLRSFWPPCTPLAI